MTTRFSWPLARLLGLFLWLLAACEAESNETSILLTIDSDFSVPGELDRISVDSPGMDESMDEPSADLRAKALPRSIALRHAGGPYGPFKIVVRGYRAETLVAEKTVQTSFLPNLSSHLSVTLTRGCANVFCGESATCSAGSCAPVAEVMPRAESDDDEQADAGSDASVARPDAGVTVTSDAGNTSSDAGNKLDAGAALDARVPIDSGSALDGGPKDAGSVADARSQDAAASPDTGPSAGATPVCNINRPMANDTITVGAPYAVQGSCTDTESSLLLNVAWVSNVDGQLLTGVAGLITLRTAGPHNIALCAPDPRASAVVGCATVRVNAALQPTARIVSIRQGMSTTDPFAVGAPITLQGTAMGANTTLRWTDSLQGVLGTTETVVITSPVAGFHLVTLQVTDQFGLVAVATRSFLVR